MFYICSIVVMETKRRPKTKPAWREEEKTMPDDQTTDETHKLPSLSIDWELYASYLEESGLSEDQKRDFIETIWSIVVAFVDLGFGVHSLQQGCEQVAEMAPRLSPDMLSSLQDIPDNRIARPADDSSRQRQGKEES